MSPSSETLHFLAHPGAGFPFSSSITSPSLISFSRLAVSVSIASVGIGSPGLPARWTRITLFSLREAASCSNASMAASISFVDVVTASDLPAEKIVWSPSDKRPKPCASCVAIREKTAITARIPATDPEQTLANDLCFFLFLLFTSFPACRSV